MASGRHTEGNKRGLTSIALVVVLVAAVVALGWVAFGPDDDASAGSCDGNRAVVISVVPSMQAAMERALEDLKAEDGCFPAELRAESPAAVENSFFNGGRPDLWVADTPARVDRLASIGINTTTLSPSLAMTPVGIVGGINATQHESWTTALESKNLLLSGPDTDSSSALTLVAPVMEMGQTGFDQERINQGVVLAAQEYGSLARSGEVQTVNLAEIGANDTAIHPVTEQDYVTRGAGNDNLRNVTPNTGAPVLTFPLVKANGGAPDTDVVANAVREWFQTASGRAALTESGLRAPDGAPLEGKGFFDSELLADVPSEPFNSILGTFNVLSIPSSLLAVYDLSGSMNFAAPGGGTRMDLASDAGLQALANFPPQTRIGLWGFSIDQGGPGQDWIDMAPLKRLDDMTQGQPHSEYLRKRLSQMRDRVRGGTGLYDTTLAAYQRAVQNYDRGFFNTVILITDGANEDPGSISLDRLLDRLQQMQDPNRPVRVIAIGITTDADMDALRQIATSTSGTAYLAEDPNDILDVLAHAMMSR